MNTDDSDATVGPDLEDVQVTPPTCGEGLAENAVTPAAMSRLLGALARVLETHIPTIDTSDGAGTAERDAYARLSTGYGRLAEELGQTAADMATCRDLPAAAHVEEALANPSLLEAFREYVLAEEDLVNLLRETVQRDRTMLNALLSAR